MLYHVLTSIASNSPWILLIGYSIFRFFRYSGARYPRQQHVSKKDYNAWREMESAGLYLPIIGLIGSSMFTIMFTPNTQEQYINYAGIRSLVFIVGIILVIVIQVSAKSKAKKLGILNK